MTLELPVTSPDRGGHVRDAAPGFLLGKLADWSREKSLWPATFGLACCAIEMMAASASNYDIEVSYSAPGAPASGGTETSTSFEGSISRRETAAHGPIWA